MPAIADLLAKQPSGREITVSAEGHVLWLVWDGEPSANVAQTLQDYGGLNVLSNANASLWFFFTTDSLLALAKLVVWGKFNPLAATILAFPGSLQVGVGQVLSVAMDKPLAKQELDTPKPGIQVWIHPKLKETGSNVPGLTYVGAEFDSGMAKLKWTLLGADPRLPYASSQGWYALLKPLGNPLDKNFQNGWRNLFANVETILQTRKLKYSLYDNYLMLPLENLSQLRIWASDLLRVLDNIKEHDAAHYWPCVSAVVDKRGLNFNNELPQKVNIPWDELMPDYPFMSYRNAYLLGEDFAIQDRYFSNVSTSIDNWCTVSLHELDTRNGSVPVLMSGQLVSGPEHCFYCGVRTHRASQCPSRRLPPVPSDYWYRYADIDLDTMNAAYREIEMKLATAGNGAYLQMLEKEGPESRVLEGLFALESQVQLRSVERIWALTGKDIDAEADGRGLAEDSPAWNVMERLQRSTSADLNAIEKEIMGFLGRSPRDWRLHSALGFVATERGDLQKAASHWRDAENLCSMVLHQAWHMFLRAYVHELSGRYNEALDGYEMAHRLLPQWQRAEYRQLVCRIKIGFGEQVCERLIKMVGDDPTLFNRILLDPDLERGRKPILTALYPLWVEAQKRCQTERVELGRLIQELETWFPPEHEAARKLSGQLQSLLTETGVKNYLSFFNVVTVRPTIEEETSRLIQREIEVLQAKYKHYLAVLEVIRDEASWFPFQKALVEFNRDFNEAAGKLNWAFTADFHQPESFKKAQSFLPSMAELLVRLEKRLRVLRMARDATLFILVLLRTFLWIEIVSLTLCTIAVVVLLFYGSNLGMEWMQRIIRANFWELQKVLVIILSLLALGIAALRTTLIFDKTKDKMLKEARAQREEMQRERLEKAKAKREAAQKKAAEEK